ncbi:MAG: hypothetical protein SNI51_03445 [Rikenellaceae bacterium]
MAVFSTYYVIPDLPMCVIPDLIGNLHMRQYINSSSVCGFPIKSGMT